MLAGRRSIPIHPPEFPCVLRVSTFDYLGVLPRTIVYPNLDCSERLTPSSTVDSVQRTNPRNSCRDGIDTSSTYGFLPPDCRSFVRFFSYRHIVPRDESSHVPRLTYFNPFQPFHLAYSVPTRDDKAKRKSMLLRQRLTVHLIAQKYIRIHCLLNCQRSSEVLLHS